jgi:hypothetical protein
LLTFFLIWLIDFSCPAIEFSDFQFQPPSHGTSPFHSKTQS